MISIPVSASQKYEVLIGTGLLDQAGTFLTSLAKGRAVIISDTNVWPIYGKALTDSLHLAGIPTLHYTFPAGEESKNAATYLEILNFLVENKITRSDLIIALGGGVVGDISGFTAATYLRGIDYVQIPTSLLAMVDSSVGGKTAIDLPAGKNLVGAFKQPKLLLCDVSTLETLPEAFFLDGCAEVIKYGILYDEELVAYLQQVGPGFDREAVIAKCVGFKAAVVAQDEFDKGQRQKLNLGHTIGHAVELKSNFSLSHGQAVAIGTAMIAGACASKGLCGDDTAGEILRLLTHFSLPTQTLFSAKELYLTALNDKKRAKDTIHLIIPRKIGNCDFLPIPVTELESFIEAGQSWTLKSIQES